MRLHIPARGVLETATCAMNQSWGGSQLHVMPKHRPQGEKVSSARLVQLLPLLAVVPVTARDDKIQ